MSAAPLFYSEAPRRAGRLRGARSAVLVHARALGIHHFAFLRAALIGVDLRAAFERYLAWSETNTDLRHIQHRRAELLKEILEAGRRLDVARAPDAKLARYLEALRADQPDARTAALPTLADWMRAERMDPDAWSESDALAEYRAAHGIDNFDEIDADEARPARRDPARRASRSAQPAADAPGHAAGRLRPDRHLVRAAGRHPPAQCRRGQA